MFGRKSKIVTKIWEKLCRGEISGRRIEKNPREKFFALVLGKSLAWMGTGTLRKALPSLLHQKLSWLVLWVEPRDLPVQIIHDIECL